MPEIDDANLAARQFMALVNADLPPTMDLGQSPSNAELETAARNAVRTFLRAYGRRSQTSSQPR